MGRRDVVLRVAVLGIILLHLAAARVAPGALWGISPLAVWPPALAVLWSAAAVAACFAWPRLRLPAPAVLGRAGALAGAAAAGIVFWLLRERTHFFGDGYLLIQDRGFSETVTRAPLLVESTARIVRAAEAWLHVRPETTLAGLAVLAGVVGVCALPRLAAGLAADRPGRRLGVALLGTAGSVQLFCGHVEYYASVAAAVLVYLALALPAVAAGAGTESRPLPLRAPAGGTAAARAAARPATFPAAGVWPVSIAYAVLLPLHLSALGLAPAHAYLLLRAWRAGLRRAALVSIPVVAAIAAALTYLAGGRPAAVATFSVTGIRRYTEPYWDPATARHAFGFLSGAHLLAVANDLLLAAPLVLLAITAGWIGRGKERTPLHRFLCIATLGCVAVNFFFARELGPYRDWDILAPYGFVLLAWTAAVLLRAGVDPAFATVLVLAAGLHHTMPWILNNARPQAALAHLRLVLDTPRQWSPGARAYMHESLAIYHRERGDAAAALAEYEAAVRANPADARYHVGLGNMYAGRGQMQSAAREYESALQRRPEYAPAHNNLAFALAALGTDLGSARDHARTALRLEPQNADYWLTLARVELADKRPAEARQALRQALQWRRPFAAAEKLLESLPE